MVFLLKPIGQATMNFKDPAQAEVYLQSQEHRGARERPSPALLPFAILQLKDSCSFTQETPLSALHPQKQKKDNF